MTYRDTITQLGDETAAKVAAVYASWEEGLITEDEAVALVATIVAAANQRAAALADLGLAATLTVATRSAVAPLGLLPRAGDQQRLRKAATTLWVSLPSTPDPLARVERLGRSEPLTTAQTIRGDGIASSQLVEGWTRAVSGTGCQLCNWWSRNGRVWPKDHTMPRHKGCTCSQNPVTVERVRAVQH